VHATRCAFNGCCSHLSFFLTFLLFDDESAFLSLKSSTFTQNPNEVYPQSEMPDMNDSSYVDGYYSHVAFPSTMPESCERIISDNHDYSFLRLPNRYIDIMVDDGSESIYETIHFSDISKSFKHIYGSTDQSVENVDDPTALVAQVSYDGNESESNNLMLTAVAIHHMNVQLTEFFYMRSYRYVDGVLVKGLKSNTKAYGIGSCIMCYIDDYRVVHQTCLEDVLYVPALFHHYSRIFSVTSACSHDEF
jgi:hypothetical protein